jgi:transcription initiation factor TFIIIB Brf1 subunit/transcription initiation factor TFIIB
MSSTPDDEPETTAPEYDPDAAPWTTPVDVTEEVLEELEIADTEAADLAREYARKYDDGTGTHRPSSVAAGSVYLATLLDPSCRNVIQDELADAAGVATTTITRNYRRIAEQEGFNTGSDDAGDEDRDDDPDSLLRRIIGWFA